MHCSFNDLNSEISDMLRTCPHKILIPQGIIITLLWKNIAATTVSKITHGHHILSDVIQ